MTGSAAKPKPPRLFRVSLPNPHDGMRLRLSPLLGVMAVLVCDAMLVDAKESSPAKVSTPDSASLSQLLSDNLAVRSLRSGDEDDEGNANNETAATEERGGLPGLPQIKGLGTTVASNVKMPEQFKFWLQYSYSMDETFKILKLDEDASKLLANPQMKTWISYGRVVEEKNKLTESPVIMDLLKRFGAAKLSETIEAAKKSAWTRTIADELQDLLLSHWLQAKTDPKIVFRQLDLKMSKSVLESNPNTPVFAKYLDKFKDAYGYAF